MDNELKQHLEAMENRLFGRLDAVEERLKEHMKQADENLETKLIAEFWKWGRTAETRARTNSIGAIRVGT